MNIGLFGGTFDPIHNGHLIIAETCLQKYNLNHIIFIPSGNPPHKKNVKLTPSKDRYKMTCMAIKDNSKFLISPIEMYKTKYSYQTIAHYSKTFPNDNLFFIIGSDSLLNLHKWKKGLKLLDLCKFIVVPRPGFDIKKINFPKNKILALDNFNIGISSTNIRKNVSSNKSIKYLAPSQVEYYILEKYLYK
jgi:nicotinate-nucleotide adenylyltransferase